MTTEHLPEHSPDLGATEARQGRRGRHVFVVLLASLALIVIAYAAIYAASAGGFIGKHGNREAPPTAARSFNGPEPAPKVPTEGANAGDLPSPTASQPSATTPS